MSICASAKNVLKSSREGIRALDLPTRERIGFARVNEGEIREKERWTKRSEGKRECLECRETARRDR